MNSRKSGAGRFGRLLSSGWACVPTQKGGTGIVSSDNGGAETTPPAYDLGTPVFPVLNAIVGVQIKPIEHMILNLETGIRTLPFIGLSVGYTQ